MAGEAYSIQVRGRAICQERSSSILSQNSERIVNADGKVVLYLFNLVFAL